MNQRIRKLSSTFPIHITGRCNNRENFPISYAEVWKIFGDYLYLIRQQFEIRIFSFVMMSNHFHLICRDPELKLSQAMRIFMKETSCQINGLAGRTNRLWGARFYSSIITNPIYFLHAYKYSYRNPVAAGICRNVEDYPWSTLQILLGQKSGIIPLENDEILIPDICSGLDWLNLAYTDKDAKVLRSAFRKKIIRFPIDLKTKRKHPLSQQESVPKNLCDELQKCSSHIYFIDSNLEDL